MNYLTTEETQTRKSMIEKMVKEHGQDKVNEWMKDDVKRHLINAMAAELSKVRK